MALLARAHDLPLAERWLDKRWRITPRPIETYAAIDDVTDSLFTAGRRLEAREASESVRRRFRDLVERYLRLQCKPRFVHKHTGFSRTEFIDAIFPDALFIHVYRDGRAVANSLSRVNWWTGLEFWRWGEMKPEYRKEYRDSGEERIVLAGITWKTLMEEIEAECQGLPASRLLQVRYDELIADAPGVMRRVLGFCGLPSSERLERHIARQSILDMDQKWKRDLSPREQDLLEDSIGAHLERYGFKR